MRYGKRTGVVSLVQTWMEVEVVRLRYAPTWSVLVEVDARTKEEGAFFATSATKSYSLSSHGSVEPCLCCREHDGFIVKDITKESPKKMPSQWIPRNFCACL